MKISGIYKIINKINEKYYVGSSSVIKERWAKHKLRLHTNKHHNKYLQNAWNKDGEQTFEFLLVEEVPKENLLIVEQKYLDIAKTEQDKCYNLNFDAEGGAPSELSILRGKSHPWYGRHHTKETKEKISLEIKKLYNNKSNHPNYGKPMGEGQKRKLREANLDNHIYDFFNVYTQERFRGTRHEFQSNGKGKANDVSLLLYHHKKTIKGGWALSP